MNISEPNTGLAGPTCVNSQTILHTADKEDFQFSDWFAAMAELTDKILLGLINRQNSKIHQQHPFCWGLLPSAPIGLGTADHVIPY